MSDRVGQRFGNYELIRKLDQGASADVYLGKNIHIQTEVAIKVLRDPLSDGDKDQFITEARILAQLIHSNIVRLLDFGFENDIPYLVMDYAPNGSLAERYPKGTKVPLDTIVAHVRQLAPALQFAHNHKRIHRDVKPANMLLTYNNDVILGDFGIAVVAHNTTSVRLEKAAGTIFYMAPEQLQENPRPASDQYSLAVVVYEWLTGTLPFTGDLVNVAIQHVTKLPPPLRDIDPFLPVEVEQIVLKALAKDPEQRFKTILEFAKALERANQDWMGTTIQVTFPLPPQHHPQPVKANGKTKEQWLDEGDKLHRAKIFPGAIASYSNAIKLDENFVAAYNNRGNAYFEQHDYRKAIADYEKAIELNKRNPAASNNLGNAYNNLGNVYLALGEYTQAIANYSQAIHLNTQNANAFNNRGYTYQCKGGKDNYRKAIDDYERALAIDPNHLLARNNKFRVFILLEGRR